MSKEKQNADREKMFKEEICPRCGSKNLYQYCMNLCCAECGKAIHAVFNRKEKKKPDVFGLEKKLINWEKLRERKDELPEYCRKIFDTLDADPEALGGPAGIGWDENLGWFVLGSGQGPFLHW